jgi:uncharacterized protein
VNTVAIVTGASSGIGRSIAKRLAADGHTVVAVARRAAQLNELAAEVQAGPGRVVPCVMDLTHETAARSVVAQAIELGRLQWLVNNAGMARFGEFRRTVPSEQLQTVDLNCAATLALTAEALPHLLAQPEAHILNVASLAAFQPMPFFGITYAASKAFMLSFSEGLSEELRHSGVRVTALCPGAVETEFDLLAAPHVRRARQWDELTPDECAAIGIAAAKRGEVVVVRGIRHRANTLLVKFAPRWFVRRELARRRGGVVGFPKEILPDVQSA